MFKGESKKLILLSVLGAFVVLAALIVGYNYDTHIITFDNNGDIRQVETAKGTVGKFLRSQGIEYSVHDKITPSPDQTVEEGMTVVYKKSIPVVLVDGAAKKTIYATESTVQGILQEQGISLGEQDRVEPELQTKINENEEIRIFRITTQVVEEMNDVVFNKVRKSDRSLGTGQVKTVQKGKNGKALYRYEVTYENGEEVSRKLINAKIIEEKADEVVAVGASGPVSRGGITFMPRRVLTMELTAYGAGVEHTGKTSEHPQYGITRTGTKVQEGRTIAVDPNVIPLGWWVYIEGFGYRRAEDTGSAVKGNRIDIYFADDNYANNFGLKKGYTVYIIGPNKPE